MDPVNPVGCATNARSSHAGTDLTHFNGPKLGLQLNVPDQLSARPVANKLGSVLASEATSLPSPDSSPVKLSQGCCWSHWPPPLAAKGAGPLGAEALPGPLALNGRRVTVCPSRTANASMKIPCVRGYPNANPSAIIGAAGRSRHHRRRQRRLPSTAMEAAEKVSGHCASSSWISVVWIDINID